MTAVSAPVASALSASILPASPTYRTYAELSAASPAARLSGPSEKGDPDTVVSAPLPRLIDHASIDDAPPSVN